MVYTSWETLEPFGNGDALSFFSHQTLTSARWNDIGQTRTDPRGFILECPAEGLCPELNIDLACGPVATGSPNWGTVKARF